MAPIKFEEQLKEKLGQRTIQPSGDAWEQLSNKLDTTEKHKSRRLFFYIGIAASLVGILLVSNVMFNTSSNQSVEPMVVDVDLDNAIEDEQSSFATGIVPEPKSNIVTTTVDDVNTPKEDKVHSPSVRPSIKNEPKVAVISNQNIPSEAKSQPSLNPITEKALITEQSESVVTTTNAEKQNLHEVLKPASTMSYEDAKAFQVVAEIKELEINNGNISDVEIESLLKQAEKEILQHKIFNETTRTVDVDALLQDVEEDLEQSFRAKVFEGLKSSYKTVKTAVAERNN